VLWWFGGEGKIVIGSGYRGRIALVGVAAAVLLLSGCGRKGMLEAPPSASSAAAPSQPSHQGALGEPEHAGLEGERTGEQAVATAPSQRTFPLDWLLK
jgi:predicted small lipoprotein YifL